LAITNYGELKTAVASRAIRTDLTALLPDFIRSAHDVIVGALAVCNTVSADAATETLPTDCREVIAIVVDGYPAWPLGLAHADQVENSGTGVPQYYKTASTTLHLYPTPDDTYSLRVLHKLSRTMFSADADYNTALTRYPFLYLNGAMAELFAHTRNIDQEAKYRQLFARGLEMAAQAETEDAYAGATLQPKMQGVI
jgi:hypothetical protein